jgi:hypothetical protein
MMTPVGMQRMTVNVVMVKVRVLICVESAIQMKQMTVFKMSVKFGVVKVFLKVLVIVMEMCWMNVVNVEGMVILICVIYVIMIIPMIVSKIVMEIGVVA